MVELFMCSGWEGSLSPAVSVAVSVAVITWCHFMYVLSTPTAHSRGICYGTHDGFTKTVAHFSSPCVTGKRLRVPNSFVNARLLLKSGWEHWGGKPYLLDISGGKELAVLTL